MSPGRLSPAGSDDEIERALQAGRVVTVEFGLPTAERKVRCEERKHREARKRRQQRILAMARFEAQKAAKEKRILAEAEKRTRRLAELIGKVPALRSLAVGRQPTIWCSPCRHSSRGAGCAP